MSLTMIGLDTAKSTFQIHGADENGRTLLKRRLHRHELVAFFEGSKVPASVQDLTVQAGAANAPATPAAGSATPSNGATATPTPTPSATPQGGGS